MAIKSKGTKITINDSPPVDIPEVSSIAGPQQNKSMIDTTHLLSTDREFTPDFSENSFTFDMNFDPGDVINQRLEAAFNDDEELSFIVTYTQLSPEETYTFNGFIENLGPQMSVGDKATRSVGVKISGAVTHP